MGQQDKTKRSFISFTTGDVFFLLFFSKMVARSFFLIGVVFLAVINTSEPQGGSTIGCFVPHQCLGASGVGLTALASPEECLDYCSGITDCHFFTHYADSGYCLAFSDCPASDSNCSDCISGTNICIYTHTFHDTAV